MKSTGIVRRIDDLGRIVIPKEIRRNLHIKENEEVEIFIDNEYILLRKFSRLLCLEDISKKIIDIVSKLINKTVIISDKEKYIYGCGLEKKKYLNEKISGKLNETFNNRNIFYIDNMLSYPIVSLGDVIGLVIFIGDYNENDVSIIKLVAQFLGKYVED